MEQLHGKVQKVADLLSNSSHDVMLTGSGVSDKRTLLIPAYRTKLRQVLPS